jgi:hypothetical protein
LKDERREIVKVWVFKTPVGGYKALYDSLVGSGWHVLGVKRHGVRDEWLVRAANKYWFFSLPKEDQERVARQEPVDFDSRLSDVIPIVPVKRTFWQRVRAWL